MSETAKNILKVFKKFRTGKNEIIMMGSLLEESFKWERNHQDNFLNALKELEDTEFVSISRDNMTVKLLENGYNYLY